MYKEEEFQERSESSLHSPTNSLNVSFFPNNHYIWRLDDNKTRNWDYILAVNFFTSVLLLKIGKFREALNFLIIAEKMVIRLFEK